MFGDFSAAWGREAAARILADGWPGATVITAAEVIALGVLARLLHQGRAVPDKFRVIGFGGIGAVALAHPSLTTVRQPVETMADQFELSSTPKTTRCRTGSIPHSCLGKRVPLGAEKSATFTSVLRVTTRAGRKPPAITFLDVV